MMEVSTQKGNSATPLSSWVKQAQDGARLAFEEMVRMTEGRARKTAFPLVRPDLVEDAVQEAYLVVFQKLHHLRKPEAFQGWLCRIVINVCHAMRKKHPPTTELDDQAQTADPTKQVDNHLALREALSQLPEDSRNALIMREFLKLDYEEIGFALRLPVGTVKSRLHYGRKKLAKLLRQ